MLRKVCKGRADLLGWQGRPETFSHLDRRFFRDQKTSVPLQNNYCTWITTLLCSSSLPAASCCTFCLAQEFSCLESYGKWREQKRKYHQFLPTFFLLWAKAFAAPLGCRLSYLKPVMTPLYPSEWLICSLKECRWASLIGTWIFLKDVAGSGIGNITHNIK